MNEQKTNKERTKNEQKTVRAARADKEMTNERRTKDEQKTVRAARADGERTNKERRKCGGKLKLR